MYLNCHSYFSLRYGTFSEKELLELGQKHHQKVLSLTDINNTSGCLSFVRLATEYNIKPIIGIDFRLGAKQLFVAIAKNNKGFQEINSYLSYYSHNKQAIPEEAPPFNAAIVIYPLSQIVSLGKDNLSPNEYIGISTNEIPLLHRSPYFHYLEKMVLLHQVTFRHKRDFNVHRLLRAIDNNTLLSKLPKTEEGQLSDTFLKPETINQIEQTYPLLLRNTETIQNECSIYFDFSTKRKHQNLLSFFGDSNRDYKFIEKLCQKGLKKRYDEITPIITARIEKELATIKEMDFLAFFLANWKIIRYAKSKDYYHVGRGSGANSIVAYLLGITDVDPIELDLYFERFMNLYRANPPDFDIDFSSKDRNDVTNFIFEYFKGSGQVALLATYNCFKHSGAVRELGKVFGLPKPELDLLSDGKYDANKLDDIQTLIVKYSQLLIGIPNHLSVHSSGIIISEKPIHYFSATNLPPKGFPTVQFDMEIAEDVGLFKYDILGQRGLGKIKDTLAIIKENRPNLPPIDIHDVKSFMHDPKINKNVSEAKCIGCFYVESPAMRMLLKKLGVSTYLELVAASSIIRPGVAKSGMMREYILRHRDPERQKQAHPVMLKIMPETYGIMVYQEDVIKVAHYFAGLDLAEADQLRRGMSGKFRSRDEFVKVKRKFINNCREKGIPEETIKEVWHQTESFAGYAFAKGHSASYAVESYQSLFLKTYYPLEYMVAVLNNGGGFYRTETYVHEARLHGAHIHSPDINISQKQSLIKGKHIYLGLNHLHNLDTDLIDKILLERNRNGSYKSIENFLDRIDTGSEQIEILLRIGAFNYTGINRRELLWKALYKLNKEIPKTQQNELFKHKAKEILLPKLNSTKLEDAFDQMEILGYPLCNPFHLAEKTSNNNLATDMESFLNTETTLYGYLVTRKRTVTAKGQNMYFGTFIDKKGQWIDTVHFPPVAAKYPFKGQGVYELKGKVIDEFDFLSIEITQMYRISYIQDPRYTF